MVEPEMAFYDLCDDMDLAEGLLKRIFRDVLEKCPDDMEFFNERIDKTVLETLQHIIDSEFLRVPYTEAIEHSGKVGRDSSSFPSPGAATCNRSTNAILTEKHFKCPVILYDYPRTIKPFYMRLNDDGKTVRAMDVLVPKVGEIIGGSQREERLDVLEMRMDEQDLNPADYWWYLDLRRYGTVPHAGFGLGVERVLLFITGMANIRDVIPFPRTPAERGVLSRVWLPLRFPSPPLLCRLLREFCRTSSRHLLPMPRTATKAASCALRGRDFSCSQLLRQSDTPTSAP